MQLVRAIVGTGCVLLACTTIPVSAQALDPKTSDVERDRNTPQPTHRESALPESSIADAHSLSEESETISEDLGVSHLIGIGYSSSGPGYDGFGRFDGFIPVWQELGEDVVFLETRLLIDNGAHLGGNLLLGGRHYDPERNQILGGYTSFDTRSTGDSTFYQLGVGFERLANWDLRVNGYVPLGNTQQRVSATDFVDTGLNGITTGFEGRQLILNADIEQTRFLDREIAFAGFDIEAGGVLARWKQGELRGYAGTYLYAADGQGTTVGGSARLDIRPRPNIKLGIGVRGDERFGTNIIATVGATFPSIRPNRELDEKERVIARLGENVFRDNAITVDTVTETDIGSRTETSPLFNPEEEQPYRFTHVTLGAAGGDGTFENPFGTVAEALAATVGDGNDVVYVDGEAGIPIPAFAIPDTVRVLSQGPRQVLAGQVELSEQTEQVLTNLISGLSQESQQALSELKFPGISFGNARLRFSREANFTGINVELPSSGDGVFPTIAGGGDTLVTLGNNTVLAGFQLQDAAANAVLGSEVTNVELRNNAISWSGANTANGILLDNVGGSATLFDNSVSGAGDRGISIQNTSLEQSVQVAIEGFQVEGGDVGVEVVADGLTVQEVIIGPSNPFNTSVGVAAGTSLNDEITGNASEGLIVQANNSGIQELDFNNGSITNNGAGVVINATDEGIQGPISFTDSVISDNRGNGIEVNGGIPGLAGAFTFVSQEVSVNNSQIERNQGDGINIEAFGIAIQGFSIGNSTIANNTGAGIRSTAGGDSQQEFNPNTGGFNLAIGNNTITGNGDSGIILDVGDNGILFPAATLLAEIEGNTLSGNGGADGDIVVTAVDTNASACVYIVDNTVPAGINLTIDAPPVLFEVQDLPNFVDINGLSPINNSAPVTLNPAPAFFTTPSGDGVCFAD